MSETTFDIYSYMESMKIHNPPKTDKQFLVNIGPVVERDLKDDETGDEEETPTKVKIYDRTQMQLVDRNAIMEFEKL